MQVLKIALQIFGCTLLTVAVVSAIWGFLELTYLADFFVVIDERLRGMTVLLGAVTLIVGGITMDISDAIESR